MSVSKNRPVVQPRYHTPSPLVWLIGHANEATVVVEGVEMMALADTGSQISDLTKGFCSEFGLRILPLGVCCISQGQGISQNHTRDIEAYLTIPGLAWYNKDMLFLVIPDHKYEERVLVEIGTKVIDHLVMIMTKEEFQEAGDTWKQVHLSTVI